LVDRRQSRFSSDSALFGHVGSSHVSAKFVDWLARRPARHRQFIVKDTGDLEFSCRDNRERFSC